MRSSSEWKAPLRATQAALIRGPSADVHNQPTTTSAFERGAVAEEPDQVLDGARRQMVERGVDPRLPGRSVEE
jgi:hypothetical protein